jgi:translation initiation factor IF-2
LKNKISLPKIFLQSSVKNLINPGEISCVKVKKIKSIKNKYKFVYDFTVSDSHNFVAERIFVHNTTILDFIRNTKISEKETGGITQHIGAYEVEHPSPDSGQVRKITFIDTPGHEAFSAIRSRGAKVADIAILVVAADEGVKPQTKEAIYHIKKAGIPMIVALNKIDKPEANPEKVKRELAEQEVLVESFGGKVPCVEVSAKTGKGINDLLELILLVAEMENLKADFQKPAEGVIIEAYLDNLRGPTATLILSQGILKIGDILGTHSTFGKVKTLENFQGEPQKEAFPSMPVIVVGFEEVPQVGEKVKVFSTIEEAKKYLKKVERPSPEVVLIEEDKKVLNLILKTDVLGSLEAIEEILKNLPQEKVVIRILKGEVGEINESDVKLAQSAKAKILGFRVKINPLAKNLAEREKIKIKIFEVIYDLSQEIRALMAELLEPEIIKVSLGKVKILAIFRTEKDRQIIGGKVIEGEIKKGERVEVFHDEELVGKGKIINLQKDKKDVEKVIKGQECGIFYEGTVKIEEGDILEVFREEKRKGEL